MSGISSKAESTLSNKYKFNAGTELNNDFDISIYETPFRRYDPQIGRFHQIDILADAYDFVTPYQFAFNNPNIFNDPSGALTNAEFNKVIDDLGSSKHGGSWNANSGCSYFDSDAQAFEAGAEYMSQYKTWGKDGAANSFGDAQNSYYANGGTDQGVKSLMKPIFVYGNIKNGKWNTNFVDYSGIQASFLDGNYSAQDLINMGLAFAGSGFATMEGIWRNERTALYAKGVQNGMNSFYRREVQNLDKGIGKFGKLGKKLGVVGAGITAASLGYKYFNGGITKKDAFDAAVSGVLLAITVTNPIGLVALGLFGLFDSMGAFDGLKQSIGADDTIISKYE